MPELVTSFEDLVARAAAVPRPVVLVDGGSGAGKTSLGERLAPALGAQLVSLDDIYPGWDGLEAGSAAVVADVLRSEDPGWRGWDWTTQQPGIWHPVDPARPLVVEGCGALSRAARRLATLGVWVELDAASRRRRALARDGDAYAPHWDRWARQEAAFAAREHPHLHADVTWPVTRAPHPQPRRWSSSSSMPK
ncbi:ATP-binding protein [Pseudolysinimonas kribbensis]|uniref:ATP-binding protein n=1 Tax=Pseudolysinimonas kribbensis TaxID=433641 RepID=UPI0031CDB938